MVAVLFPDGVIGIFYSERTVALGSTQAASNSNEYQKYFMGGKDGRCGGWQPYHNHVPVVSKSGSFNLLEP